MVITQLQTIRGSINYHSITGERCKVTILPSCSHLVMCIWVLICRYSYLLNTRLYFTSCFPRLCPRDVAINSSHITSVYQVSFKFTQFESQNVHTYFRIYNFYRMLDQRTYPISTNINSDSIINLLQVCLSRNKLKLRSCSKAVWSLKDIKGFKKNSELHNFTVILSWNVFFS